MPPHRPRRTAHPRQVAPPSPPPPPPPQTDDSRIFVDLLWIAFTISVVVTVGKFLINSSAVDIIEFVEGEKFFLGFSLLLICMSVITVYGYLFYIHKRYVVFVDLARAYVRAAQNLSLQFRSSFFWLRNVIAIFHPNQRNFEYINLVFKCIFLFGLLLLASFIGYYLCTHKNVENLTANFVILGLYYSFVFSPNEIRFEKLISHLGYTSLHSGTMCAYFECDEIGYILINVGVALFILCIVWNFVNVPRNQEADIGRRR